MSRPATPLACFVTGTDTEIGKTLVSCALLLFWQKQGLRTLGLKPIAAGTEQVNDRWCNEDVEALASASTELVPLVERTPYLLRTPAAPHLAAALDHTRIENRTIVQQVTRLRTRADAVVVEGVGGFRVPLNEEEDTADLAVALNLPIVLVVGLRLGCINQALLTYEAVVSRGLRVAGWVANQGPGEMPYAAENVQAIGQRLEAPLLGWIPRVAGNNATERAAQAVAHLDAATMRQAFSR